MAKQESIKGENALGRQTSSYRGEDFGQKIVLKNFGDKPVSVGQKCPKCNMRIRGLNHENGHHHNGAVPKHVR